MHICTEFTLIFNLMYTNISMINAIDLKITLKLVRVIIYPPHHGYSSHMDKKLRCKIFLQMDKRIKIFYSYELDLLIQFLEKLLHFRFIFNVFFFLMSFFLSMFKSMCLMGGGGG